MRRLAAGASVGDIAEFLEVTPRSVQRWARAAASTGRDGLKAVPAPGRPPKLDHTQEKVVHRWLTLPPRDLGFATDLWTTGRLAALIRRTWRVDFNPRYLCDWLGRRGYTPQKPQRVPRERDAAVIGGWCRHEWPRILKKRAATAGTWCSSTRADC
jgi:transposase